MNKPFVEIPSFQNHSSDRTLEGQEVTFSAGCQSDFVSLTPTLSSAQQCEELATSPWTHIPKRAPPRWAAWSKSRHPRMSPAVSIAMSPFRACREEHGMTHKPAAPSRKRRALGRTSILTHSLTHTHTGLVHRFTSHTCSKNTWPLVRPLWRGCTTASRLATRTHRLITYIPSCESNHGEKDDAQFGLWHLGAHCSQDGHDGTRLQI